MKKKILSILLISAMMLSLTACDTKADSGLSNEDNAKKKAVDEDNNANISYEKLSEELWFTDIYTESPNSAGGVDFGVQFNYTGEKDIKYITITTTPYNSVHDVVSSDINSISTAKCEITGPIKHGEVNSETGKVEPAWYPLKFKNLWYNNTITYALVDKVEIEYADGTTLTCVEGIPSPPKAQE